MLWRKTLQLYQRKKYLSSYLWLSGKKITATKKPAWSTAWKRYYTTTLLSKVKFPRYTISHSYCKYPYQYKCQCLKALCPVKTIVTFGSA